MEAVQLEQLHLNKLKTSNIINPIVLIIVILGSSITWAGCATILEDMTTYTHTAFLAIGSHRDKITPQVEHILGKPIRELYMDKNTEDELLLLEYNFTVDYNLVLYYYKNRLIQTDLHKPGEYKYPDYGSDYKTVTKDVPPGHIAGYLLTSNGKTASIKTLWRKK